jgi:hypothetical protein
MVNYYLATHTSKKSLYCRTSEAIINWVFKRFQSDKTTKKFAEAVWREGSPQRTPLFKFIV